MKIEKLNLDGKKDSIEVLDSIFSGKINKILVENALYKTNANYKGRHGKTKQQNEIKGSTSKIYAQKGTGNARHASRKAPIFVGGGVAHGPKGQSNYKIRKLNKNEKKLSIASLITEKSKLKDLIIFDDFIKEIKKTKEMNNLLLKFNAKNSLLSVNDTINPGKTIEIKLSNITIIPIIPIGHAIILFFGISEVLFSSTFFLSLFLNFFFIT